MIEYTKTKSNMSFLLFIVLFMEQESVYDPPNEPNRPIHNRPVIKRPIINEETAEMPEQKVSPKKHEVFFLQLLQRELKIPSRVQHRRPENHVRHIRPQNHVFLHKNAHNPLLHLRQRSQIRRKKRLDFLHVPGVELEEKPVVDRAVDHDSR